MAHICHKEKTMNYVQRTARSAWTRLAVPALAAALLVTSAGCGHLAMLEHGNIQRPSAEAFGLGPRISVNQTYTATLHPQEPLRLRRLQTVPVLITDARGVPVENAVMAVDGGMPEHGHGLPTQPRVTHALGGGRYEIEGLRFNMGGWWELKLAINSAAGTDRVTFNLSL
jgi:hypothetical protein